MLDTANGETAAVGLYRNEGPLAVATWLREVVYPALDATDVAGDLGAYVAQLLALPMLKPLLTRLPQFRSALLYTHELYVLRYEPHNRPRSHSRWYAIVPSHQVQLRSLRGAFATRRRRISSGPSQHDC